MAKTGFEPPCPNHTDIEYPIETWAVSKATRLQSYLTTKGFAFDVFGKMDKPTPSDKIPAYVADGLARQDTETLQAIIHYCERLIDYYDQDIDESELADENEEVVDVEETDSGAVVIKKVPCGKDNCSTCPHGPYKYLVTREGDSVKWEYKGATE